MVLLDTHAIYWLISGDPKLPEKTRELILNDDNVNVSIISFWEMAIKESIGKIGLPAPITEMMTSCEEMGFNILHITSHDLELLRELPMIHRDPFDRMLICQAKSANLALITRDEIIPKYDLRTIW